MWPVSAAFLTAISGSHTATFRGELWQDGALARAGIAVTAGSVSVDRTRSTRRTITATLLDDDGTLTPNDAHDLLVPAGTQLRVWRGVDLGGGVVEDVPLGVFRLIDPAVSSEAGVVSIELSGQDESVVVAANRLVTAWTSPAGTQVGQALAEFIADRHPTAQVVNLAASTPLQSAWTPPVGAESDPWTAARDLAASYGLDIAFDASGTCVIRNLPVDSDPVAVYTTGPTQTLTRIQRSFTSDGAYSGVVVTGTPADLPPVQAIAWDNHPESATYYRGGFGAKPYFITSAFIATQAQAQATADATLPTVTGIMEQVEVAGLVNPALDVDDVIEVTDPGTRLAGDRLVIDSLTIPLTPDAAMTMTTRARPLTAEVLP